MYWTVPAVMHYNSSVLLNIGLYFLVFFLCMYYFVSLIQLLLPNQINHYYKLGPYCQAINMYSPESLNFRRYWAYGGRRALSL